VRLIVSLAVTGALSACSLIPMGPRALAACPGVLRPIDQIDGEFVLQQQIRIRTKKLSIPMRLVVQKTADELVVIGFNPIGAKLFTIQQRLQVTEIDALPRAVLPVSPLSVLRDLHRIRFLAAPPPDAVEGTSSQSFEGIVVTDTWQSGALVRREFTSPRQSSPTTLRFGPTSSSVTIDNPSCGYSSDWVTVLEQLIQ